MLGLTDRRRRRQVATGVPVRKLIASFPLAGTGTAQTVASVYGKVHVLQRGATTGAEATDPTPGATGMTFDGGDYLRTTASMPAAAGGFDVAVYLPVDINAATTAQYLIGIPDSAADGLVIGAGVPILTNEIVAIRQYSLTAAAGWCHATDVLAAGWHVIQCTWTGTAWRMWIDRLEKTLTVAGTPARPTTAGIPYVGCTANTPAGYVAAGTLINRPDFYSAPRTAAEVMRCNRDIRIKAALMGVTLP